MVQAVNSPIIRLRVLRKLFRPELEGLFVQRLVAIKMTGLFKLGKVSLDGTKIKTNASSESRIMPSSEEFKAAEEALEKVEGKAIYAQRKSTVEIAF